MNLVAGRKRGELERRWINVGRKLDEGAGRMFIIVRIFTFVRKIDWEEAWDLNTRRHGRGHRNFIAEVGDGWGKERQNILYDILDSSGGSLDTQYGEAFKLTGFNCHLEQRQFGEAFDWTMLQTDRTNERGGGAYSCNDHICLASCTLT